MSCFGGCGIDLISGVPAAGGGAAAARGYVCVWERDFRDVFTEQGAVDLNSPGATITIDGIVWETPSVANSGIDQVSAATSWGLTASGLEIVGANGGGTRADIASFPHLFANLSDIGANTATPFDADPTRKYILQIYVSAQNADAAGEGSCVGLYKVDGFPTGVTGFSTSICCFGFFSGVADTVGYFAGGGASPSQINRTDILDLDVPTIHYGGSGKIIDGYAAPFGATWPDNDQLNFIASYSDPTEVDNNTPGDPFVGWRFVMGHVGGVGSGYNAVIQQARLCQL